MSYDCLNCFDTGVETVDHYEDIEPGKGCWSSEEIPCKECRPVAYRAYMDKKQEEVQF